MDRGRVEILLADFEAPPNAIYAVWPPTRKPPVTTRLFTELLAARLKRERL